MEADTASFMYSRAHFMCQVSFTSRLTVPGVIGWLCPKAKANAKCTPFDSESNGLIILGHYCLRVLADLRLAWVDFLHGYFFTMTHATFA